MQTALGDLQKDILKTISASSQPLVPLRISEMLGKSNQAVYTSVDSLIANKILTFEEEAGRKKLMLTDKGACYAHLYCHIHYLRILFDHKYLKRPIEVDMLESIMSDNEYYDTDRDARNNYKQSMYKELFSLIVMHDEFDRDGSFLYQDSVLASTDEKNMGAVDYARRILRVFNFLLLAHPPHHEDWCNKQFMIYYRDVARRHFNKYIRFVNGKLTFF